MYMLTWQLHDRSVGIQQFRERNDALSCWNNLLFREDVARVQVYENPSPDRRYEWALLTWASNGLALAPKNDGIDEL